MAGYADEFNRTTDKTKMIEVPPHDVLDDEGNVVKLGLLSYGAGDPDAVMRLYKTLMPLARADAGNWNCFRRIIMPALGAFANTVERHGIPIDSQALAGLQSALDVREDEEYNSLIRRVPGKVRLAHATNDNDEQGRDTGLRFSRDRFTRDTLFTHPDGFRFKPRVFTKSTKGLKEAADRIPSVSAKEHLPYFKSEPFVADLIDYQRLAKMRSTYVGHPSDNDNGIAPTGFWQYIHNGLIHPSFLLHATVAGRSSSRSPNAQNFPSAARGG